MISTDIVQYQNTTGDINIQRVISIDNEWYNTQQAISTHNHDMNLHRVTATSQPTTSTDDTNLQRPQPCTNTSTHNKHRWTRHDGRMATLLNIGIRATTHLLTACRTRPVVVDLLFERVSDKQMYVLAFIKQQHGTQVAYSLVCKLWWGYQLQTF